MTVRLHQFDSLAWPASQIADAMGCLAESVGGRREQVVESLPPLPFAPGQDPHEHDRVVEKWLVAAATCMDLQALAVETTYGNVEQLLASPGPTVLRLPGLGEARLLVLVAGHRRRLTLLAPDLARHRVSTQSVADRLRSPVETDATVTEPIDQILNQASLDGKRRGTARTALLRELHGDKALGNCWLIRPTAGARLGPNALAARLGLGPLLDRMPGGMFQMVGETGWQLSHGEKSRLFIARALLQGGDLTILDESFAALDPQNLQVTLTYVLEQTPTVLVVAHP